MCHDEQINICKGKPKGMLLKGERAGQGCHGQDTLYLEVGSNQTK